MIYHDKVVDSFVVEEAGIGRGMLGAQLSRAVHLVRRVPCGYNGCKFPIGQ